MTVAHDVAAESHTGTEGSTSETSFSWSHNPVGTPRGILVLIITLADEDDITTVTYDGTGLIQVSGGEAIDTAGEPARCTAFFLGISVPTTDPATVVVNRVNNATEMYAVSITVTAGDDTEVEGVVLLQENGAYTEQSVDDGSTGIDSVRYAVGYYGRNSVPSIGANSTSLHTIDFGANTGSVARETTSGQGARLVGWTQGQSDDRAAVHLAVREVVAAPSSTPYYYQMIGMGGGK